MKRRMVYSLEVITMENFAGLFLISRKFDQLCNLTGNSLLRMVVKIDKGQEVSKDKDA